MTTEKVKTVAKAKAKAKVSDVPLPSAIKESAQQIWSVGIEAINRAQQGGNRVFEALVREGESLRENLHKKTRGSSSVSDASARATDTWDKLEQVFEKRVARALKSLGVPTHSEIAELIRRVDKLADLVRRQSGTASASEKSIDPATETPLGKARARAPKVQAKRLRTKPLA